MKHGIVGILVLGDLVGLLVVGVAVDGLVETEGTAVDGVDVDG